MKHCKLLRLCKSSQNPSFLTSDQIFSWKTVFQMNLFTQKTTKSTTEGEKKG